MTDRHTDTGADADADIDTDAATPESRYDAMAEGYARWWAPVIRPGAERVLDVLAPTLDRDGTGTRHLLDVGTGTGTLALAALERWPALRVTGIDPSGGMLEVARRHAQERLGRGAERYATTVAGAGELPFGDASFDLAVSSFVLQLVPSRAAAMREVRRVLRPGGTFAWVAWQWTDRAFAPDRIANGVLDEAGFDPPEPDTRPGDIASPEAAAQGMRRAGFRDVRARTGWVEHPWDAAGYLAFLTEFDEASLFAELEPDERGDIERTMLERLSRLLPNELTLRLPVVYVEGRAAG